MHFLVLMTFYLVTLGFIVIFRVRLARCFLRAIRSSTWAAMAAAAVFSTIEEAAHNIASGTLHVLVGTVPLLVLFVMAAGKLGQRLGATRIRYPLLGLLCCGLGFEISLGGASEGFRNPETAFHLLFGVFFTLLTYTYTAVVALVILLDPALRPTAMAHGRA